MKERDFSTLLHLNELTPKVVNRVLEMEDGKFFWGLIADGVPVTKRVINKENTILLNNGKFRQKVKSNAKVCLVRDNHLNEHIFLSFEYDECKCFKNCEHKGDCGKNHLDPMAIMDIPIKSLHRNPNSRTYYGTIHYIPIFIDKNPLFIIKDHGICWKFDCRDDIDIPRDHFHAKKTLWEDIAGRHTREEIIRELSRYNIDFIPEDWRIKVDNVTKKGLDHGWYPLIKGEDVTIKTKKSGDAIVFFSDTGNVYLTITKP